MSKTAKNKINKIEKTDEKMTGRGGITFFVQFLINIGIYSVLEEYFGDIRKNKKGLPVADIFKQIFCWFFDGTSRHITYFDDLAKDSGYAAAIEQPAEKMASSHTIKRFCKSFSIFKIWNFRKVLRRLFIWRLEAKKPEVVSIDVDTMVMDNNEAEVRHGVEPTYKRKKGFQPLQVTWDRVVVDAVFRGGSCHSNHKDTAKNTVRKVTKQIRSEYRSDVPILATIDTGFFDQKNFDEFEKDGIFYIAGARMNEEIKEVIRSQPKENFGQLKKDDQVWEFLEFGYKYKTWNKSRRFVYCRPMYENKQMLLEFERADTLLVTNARADTITKDMPESIQNLLDPACLISSYHKRGASELVNRGLKDFGFEEMPFKRFPPNAVMYYILLIAFFLFEIFKEDILHPVIPMQSYASTVRRVFIDTAAKIVSHAGQIIMKFNSAVFDRLNLQKLWEACHSPPFVIA
jgi:hypothetical protein